VELVKADAGFALEDGLQRGACSRWQFQFY